MEKEVSGLLFLLSWWEQSFWKPGAAPTGRGREHHTLRAVKTP